MTPSQSKPSKLRLLLIAGLFVGAWVLADQMGWRQSLTQERVRQLVELASVWGLVAFVALFSAGALLHIPGAVFIMAARLAWGPGVGFIVAYVVSITVSFYVVRMISGQALGDVKWPPARRILSYLDRRPRATIFALRSLMMVSPPLNYALAMSKVRYRDYLAGSTLGLMAPIAMWVLISDCVISLANAWA